MKIRLHVNGVPREAQAHPLTPLLDLLRDDLHFKGCKKGCGEGECGACAVIFNGRLVNACLIPAVQSAGADILTIEGLGNENDPHPLQQAFIDAGAVQCGFCTPGMILAAAALLERNPSPDRAEIRVALSGNLCRCTGYAAVIEAVEQAAKNGCRIAPFGRGRREQPEFAPGERFFSPAGLPEALKLLDAHPDLLLLAGCTDIAPDRKRGRIAPQGAIDIFGLPELHVLEQAGDELRIGACVTNAELMENELVRTRLPALYGAAALCGAPAVRSRAGIGGNLCTASGAADLPVALLALGASVLIRSARGERREPVAAFLKGYRKPDLEPGELLAEIRVPLPPQGAAQAFFKRGSRAALTLSRVSLAVYAERKNGRVTLCRAAAGSMSPIPVCLPEFEAALMNEQLDAERIAAAVRALRDELKPRRSSAYRKAVAGNLARRFLEQLANETS